MTTRGRPVTGAARRSSSTAARPACPTVFWNKEDPPNYDLFVETARLFDHVFTVDAGRIPDYERDLGHTRIGLLPFGAQPRIHTPVRHGAGRTREVAFAGSYFADKHDERRAQMAYVLEPALPLGLEVFSRLAGRDPRYQFPRAYAAALVGSLPYRRMLGAYTAYKVFLNVNSVTESPTMCARRLFELSAAQTPVLSGPAASIEPFFGDTVRVTHSAEETTRELRALLQHEDYRDRIGLRAHRRVLDAHTYGHRVDTVLAAVGLETPARDLGISAVVPTMRPGQVDHVLGFVAAQAHQDVELVLVTHGFEVGRDDVRRRAESAGLDPARVVVVARPSTDTLGACMNAGVDAASGRYVAKMDDDNVYAAHYLRDLVRAFDYTDAAVVGKWAHYAHLTATGATLLRFPDAEHRYVDLVQGGTLLLERDLARRLRFEDLPRRVDTTFLDKVRAEGGRVYSTDRFNFVSVRASTPGRSHVADLGRRAALPPWGARLPRRPHRPRHRLRAIHMPAPRPSPRRVVLLPALQRHRCGRRGQARPRPGRARRRHLQRDGLDPPPGPGPRPALRRSRPALRRRAVAHGLQLVGLDRRLPAARSRDLPPLGVAAG